MDIENALEYICEEAKHKGAESFDAVAGESQSLGLELYRSNVKNTEISTSRGIGIRLFKDSRPGYAFTERMTREAISQAVQDALDHALLTDKLELDLPHPARLPDLDLKKYNPGLDNITLDDMKQFCLELEKTACEKDKRIENIPYLGAGRSSGMAMIQNSNGVRFQARSNSISAGVGVVASENGGKKMGVYSNGSRDFSELNPEFMADLAVQRACELLNARSIKGGTYPVVLSNRVTPSLIGMFSTSFFAEAAQKGQSRLKGKTGEKIAVDNLNIHCNPHIQGAPGSQLIDSEGVLTSPKTVIQNGRFETFLYNLESSGVEGRSSTGNGSRGYSGKAGTDFSNLIVDKGDRPLEDLIGSMDKGLYIVKLEGASGCSPVSGEISIGVQGFLIENGKISHPVDGNTLSSNFFDLIQSIDGISNSYSDAFSSVKVPDLLIKQVHIAG